MTLKDECGYIMLVNFIGHVFRRLSQLILSIRLDYYFFTLHLRFAFCINYISYHRWPALMGICLFWQPAMFSCIQLLIMFSLLVRLITDCVLLCLFVSQNKISSSSSCTSAILRYSLLCIARSVSQPRYQIRHCSCRAVSLRQLSFLFWCWRCAGG